MNSSSVPALAISPRSARRASWRRRICRGEATTSDAVLPLEVGDHQHRSLLPGDRPQRREVGLHLEVAVAARPRGHLVALDGLHVDVDGEQVVAALRAVLEHLGEEVRGGQALALEAPLHVGDREQHGVDRAVGDRASSAPRCSPGSQATRSASRARRRDPAAAGGVRPAGGSSSPSSASSMSTLPDLAGEVLVGAHLPPDADDDQHQQHGDRRVVERLQVELAVAASGAVPRHRRRA